jgi:extradiol dioxygenase family protein
MTTLTPFHVAVPVYDLDEARTFYREVLGCAEGRTSDQWADFNLFGHQFVIHLKPRPADENLHHFNPVDGHDVPIPHYGVVLEWDHWHELVEKLKGHNIKFIIEPGIRFAGKVEFKAFKDMGQLFAV